MSSIKVEVDQGNLKADTITISLSEGLGWNTSAMNIFAEGKVVEPGFSAKPGIFTLAMNYNDELYYREIVLYRAEPKSERLRFEFYSENNRVFCKMTSEYAFELNKEIVLNELTDDLKVAVNTAK